MRSGVHRLTPFLLAVAVLVCAGAATAQNDPPTLANTGCPPNTNFETRGYRVRSARVRQPFSFLRRIGDLSSRATSIATEDLVGKPFTYSSSSAVRDKIEALPWLPDAADHRVVIEAYVTSVENCSTDELDVVYSVYATQIAALPSVTREGAQQIFRSPQTTAGLAGERGVITVKPLFTYNATDDVGSGMSATYKPVHAAGVIDAFSLSAAKMRNGRMLETSINGNREHDTGLLSRSSWNMAYANTTTPALGSDLRRAQATAQYSLLTQPIKGVAPLRFGVQAGGGKHDTTDASADPLEENRRYATVKLLGGVTANVKGNSIAASYGVEFGSMRQTSNTWRKHIIDIADDVAIPVKRNHLLEIETRLNVGRLHADGATPKGTQFFGGNKEELFTADSEWQLRSNPVIRSIPANRFTLATGADAFAALNLTVAYPLKGMPIVPSALTDDPMFDAILETQLESAQSALRVDYFTKDEHFPATVKFLPRVVETLAKLKGAVAARAADGAVFKECISAVNLAERRTKNAQKAKGPGQYGDLVPLLPQDAVENGEDRLQLAASACDSANAGPKDAMIGAATAELREEVSGMLREFRQIDKPKAEAAAKQELGIANRTLHTLLYQANIFSVGPAFMFDVARLKHAGSPLTRYGVGGGIRMTLVSTVNFTVGYLANPTRLPNESRGAFTVSMQFRDFLQ